MDDSPWDLQTGHGIHVAGVIYAWELMKGNNVVIGRREKFQHVSQEWHKFWQFGLLEPGFLECLRFLVETQCCLLLPSEASVYIEHSEHPHNNLASILHPNRFRERASSTSLVRGSGTAS